MPSSPRGLGCFILTDGYHGGKERGWSVHLPCCVQCGLLGGEALVDVCGMFDEGVNT